MKKLFTSVLIIALLSFSNNLSATHIMGGEISYTCLGGNNYEITLNLYRDCYGVSAPTTALIEINSSCFSTQINVPEDSASGQLLPGICPSLLTACNGGTLPGVTRHSYTTVVSLIPCTDYEISYGTCCRNNSIFNIVNPSGTSFKISATLDNVNAPCNSSPVFSNLPVPFICAGESFSYDHGAFEADGDSLVYYFVSAVDENGVPVQYASPFSPTNPLPTDSGIVLDASTGMLDFIPSFTGSYIVTVKVDEYRNGTLVGSVFRDMQFGVTVEVCNIDTNNVLPQVDSAFLNLTGGTMIDSSTIITCAGNTVVFDVVVSDPDINDSINFSWGANGNGSIQYTKSGTNPVTYTIYSFAGFFGQNDLNISFSNTICDFTTLSFTIIPTPGIDNYYIDSQQPSCGNSDGSLSIVLDSITNPSDYNYLWSTGDTSLSATGLSEGLYTVTISKYCTVVDSFYLYDSCGSISGTVFEDLNGNGVQDPGEMNMSGVMVYVEGNGLTFSTVTGITGYYEISVPDFTTYTVTIDPPNYLVPCGSTTNSWVPASVSAPTQGNYSVVISSTNSTSSGNIFGVEPPPTQCGTVEGFVYDDVNGNGVFDAGDLPYAGALIMASTGESTLSDQNGNYVLSVPLNTSVTVELVPGSNYFYCGVNNPSYVQTFPANNGTYSVTLTTSNQSSTGNDFGVLLNNAGYDVGVAFIWSTQSLSAGDDFNVWMDYKSFGTTTVNCTLRLDFDPLLTFDYAAIPPDNIGSTFLEWVYPPGTTPSWYCLNVVFTLDSSAVAGDPIEFTGSWDCGGTDACPQNDTLQQSFTVQFGPLKTGAYEAVQIFSTNRQGLMPYTLTESDDVLSYVISFQNTTGNDAYCFLIENPISEHLDINSISFPFSSLPFEMYINDNTVYFEFENIYVADSANDKRRSYGFIQYNINLKDNLADGTIIENKALFGWNSYNPQWTNTVEHEVEKSSGIVNIEDLDVNIYPNPTTGRVFNIQSDNSRIENVSIYNSLGRLISEEMVEGLNNFSVTVPASGVYMIEIKTSDGTSSEKLISY